MRIEAADMDEVPDACLLGERGELRHGFGIGAQHMGVIIRSFRNMADVVARREDDGIKAGQVLSREAALDIIALQKGQVRQFGVLLRRLAARDGDIMPLRCKMKGRMAADHAGSADNKNFHDSFLSTGASRLLMKEGYRF